MIKYILLNCDHEKDVVFDVCIPCWEDTKKLQETIHNITVSDFRITLPVKLIISIEKQSVVLNRFACLGVSYAPYVLWLDDDVQFKQRGWDKHLYDLVIADQKIGIVGVNVVNYKAMSFNPIRQHGEINDVCGAVMMCRKISGVDFDKNYIRSQIEDTDYCWSVRKAGYKVLQDNRVYVLHYNEEINRDYTHNGTYFDKKWGVELFKGRK